MITSAYVTGVFTGIAIAYVIDKARILIKDLFVYREIINKNERKKVHRNK